MTPGEESRAWWRPGGGVATWLQHGAAGGTSRGGGRRRQGGSSGGRRGAGRPRDGGGRGESRLLASETPPSFQVNILYYCLCTIVKGQERLSLRRHWATPAPPLPQTSVYPPPTPPPEPKEGGTHSPAACGRGGRGGESQFRRLEKSLELCLLCGL